MKNLLLSLLIIAPYAYGMDDTPTQSAGAQSAAQGSANPEVKLITEFEYEGNPYKIQATKEGIFLIGNGLHQLLHKSSYKTTGPRDATFDIATDYRVSLDKSQVALLLADEELFVPIMMGVSDDSGCEATVNPVAGCKAREIIIFDLKKKQERRKRASFEQLKFHTIDPFAD